MSYLDQWARENLSPEYQAKFFAEQDKIAEDCKRIDKWFGKVEDAMDLTSEQVEFIRKHEIVISTAYIGMVRFYIGNRTIFQTSAMDSIGKAIFSNNEYGGMTIDYDNLTQQVHEYLDLLMSAPAEFQEKLLNNHMPLFGTGELDKVKAMCGKRDNVNL